MERRQRADDWLGEADGGREEPRISARLSRLLVVASEVTKEDDEATGTGQHHHVCGVRKIPVGKQVAAAMDGDQEKLELEETKKVQSRKKKDLKDINDLTAKFLIEKLVLMGPFPLVLSFLILI